MNILIFRTAAHVLNVKSYNSQEIGLGRAFLKQGHNCDIIYYSKTNRIDVIEKNGLCSLRLLWSRGFPLLRSGLYHQYSSRKFLNSYDLIITSEYNQIMSLIVARKHTVGKTFVYNGPYYNMFHIPFFEPFYDLLFKKSFRKNVDFFLAKSPLSETYLLKRGFTKTETIGVGTTVSQLDIKPIESPNGLFAKKVVEENNCLLYVGSLSERKNFTFLLDVFEEVCKKEPNLKLLVIGEGNSKYVNKSLNAIDPCTRERIFLAGKVPNKELPHIYCKSKAFLLPSKKEIFGMVLLEAMQYGCKPYSSANGGALTLIENGINGFIFDKFDVEEWSNTILNTIYDDNIAKNASETIMNKYTWDVISKRILDIYDKEKQ